MIGLGIDLFGAFWIVYPDLVNRVKRIGKKGDEVIVILKSETMSSVEKYQFLKVGVVLLFIGFLVQIIGHSFQLFNP